MYRMKPKKLRQDRTRKLARCLIDIVQLLRFTGVSLYPLSYSFTINLKVNAVDNINRKVILIFYKKT